MPKALGYLTNDILHGYENLDMHCLESLQTDPECKKGLCDIAYT